MNIAEEILKERYYQSGEDWPALCRRVAHAIAKGEAGKGMEEEFYDCLVNKKFLPNSPTLMNAGIDGTLSACFTVDVEDNMESIFDTVKDMAIIGKWGGGVGASWSKIRPNGSKVGSTNGVASGPVSFLSHVDSMAEVVKQGGRRRMAVMSILNVDHPDIKEFIKVKDDPTKLKNMNMSVMITDEFMNKVETGDKEALEIWNLIIEHAWRNSEPGVLFYDRINQDNFTPNIPINTTNPCVSGDTVILTNKGYVRIDNVEDQLTTIWNGYEWSNVIPHVTGYNQDLMLITFSDGSELKCTPYHKFVLKNGNIIEAQDLSIGLKLTKYKFPIIEGNINEDNKLMYTKGFYSGDGFYETNKDTYGIDLYGDKKELIDNLVYVYSRNDKCNGNDSRIYLRLDSSFNFDKCFVPDCNYSIQNRLSWLAGIIDSDGCKNSVEGSISIASINKEFLLNIKYMLNTVGINTHITLLRKACKRLLPDSNRDLKEYDCKECYRLTISATCVKTLLNLGLTLNRVIVNPQPNRDAGRFISVKSMELLDEKADKVYCFNEPKNHTGCFNGIMTAQCAEESMIPYSSCNLISIDLSKLVKDGLFDWEEFKYLIKTAIKFADSTIDVNKFPLKRIEEVTKSLRPVGLGVMGFSHCLIKLGVVYGSDKSHKFAKTLFDFMKNQSIEISNELGDKLGNFPYIENSTINTPRRNCYLRSIAPTGTIATIADSTSFSIEPLFSIAYERNVLNQTFKVFDPVFEEMIEKEGLDKDKIFNLVKGKSSIQNITEIPENIRKLFVTAHDLTPLQHVQMVATIQPYIDTGISKTVNAPSDITIKEVDELYRYAWKNGCKGITIYRAGSRDAPIKLEEKPVINKDYTAPNRTFGPTERITTGCGHFHCTVSGIDKENPLKVFNDSTTGGCKANLEAIGRLSSLCLRSGISKELVIKQLSKVKCDSCLQSSKATCKSCADGVAQSIKQYEIPGSIDITNMNISTDVKIKCSNCGKEFEANTKCSVCVHCGFSRCG